MRTRCRLYLLMVSVLLVTGACSTDRTTYLPDGRRAYAISCKGLLNSWQSCLVHAGQICGTRGYNAIRSEEYDRELLFTCKNP
jgi:hypothetical protein